MAKRVELMGTLESALSHGEGQPKALQWEKSEGLPPSTWLKPTVSARTTSELARLPNLASKLCRGIADALTVWLCAATQTSLGSGESARATVVGAVLQH